MTRKAKVLLDTSVLLEAEASPDDWLASMGGPEIDDFARDLEANRPGLRRGNESLE